MWRTDKHKWIIAESPLTDEGNGNYQDGECDATQCCPVVLFIIRSTPPTYYVLYKQSVLSPVKLSQVIVFYPLLSNRGMDFYSRFLQAGQSENDESSVLLRRGEISVHT